MTDRRRVTFRVMCLTYATISPSHLINVQRYSCFEADDFPINHATGMRARCVVPSTARNAILCLFYYSAPLFSRCANNGGGRAPLAIFRTISPTKFRIVALSAPSPRSPTFPRGLCRTSARSCYPGNNRKARINADDTARV